MNFQDVLKKKKTGQVLTQQEIQLWIDGVVSQEVPDYQISALLMAIYCRSMNIEERSFLTQAMAKSGRSMDYSEFSTPKVDKHSTGGIGDKTSLIIAPILASIGLLNPMVAGRGLGHTGGTIDKLEAIPGYKTSLTFEEMKESIKNVGTFICGQTKDLAPADKKIYALRDVTQTVDEISLITASILSKKLAEDLSCLTLDVKCGKGAFMQTFEDACKLGYSLVQTANKAGVKCHGVVTRMDYPLGEWAGNACEVFESIEMMKPQSVYVQLLNELHFDKNSPGFVRLRSDNKPKDIKDLLVYFTFSLILDTAILAGQAPEEAFNKIKSVWSSGVALEKFQQMVKFQGGDLPAFETYYAGIQQQFEKQDNPNIFEFKAPNVGKITSLDGVKLGRLLVALGAGRQVAEQKVNFDVSLQWLAYPNQQLNKNQVISRVYHPDASIFDKINIQALFEDLLVFTEDVTFEDKIPLIYTVVTEKETEQQLEKLWNEHELFISGEQPTKRVQTN